MATFVLALPQRALMALVRAYRLLLSPWVGNGCRFEPSCSAYSLQALETYGATVGTYMTLHRLVRCQPFCAGGHDPVPERAPALFRHFVNGASQTSGTLFPTSTDKTSP